MGKLGGGYCFFSLFFFWPFLLLFTSTRFCIIIIFGIREKERGEEETGEEEGEKRKEEKKRRDLARNVRRQTGIVGINQCRIVHNG